MSKIFESDIPLYLAIIVGCVCAAIGLVIESKTLSLIGIVISALVSIVGIIKSKTIDCGSY